MRNTANPTSLHVCCPKKIRELVFWDIDTFFADCMVSLAQAVQTGTFPFLRTVIIGCCPLEAETCRAPREDDAAYQSRWTRYAREGLRPDDMGGGGYAGEGLQSNFAKAGVKFKLDFQEDKKGD